MADLRQAIALHRAGNLKGAIPLYRALIAANPNDFRALHFLGVAEATLGNRDEALDLMKRSLGAMPANPEFFANYAYLLFTMGRHDEALQAYGKVVALAPQNARAFNMHGVVLAELGRFDEALASFDKALRLDPKLGDAHYNAGRALDGLRRYDQAIKAYDRALALRPDHADAHVARGSALRELKRYAEACAAYDKALAINPHLKFIEGTRLHSRMHICDWTNLADEITRLHAHITEGRTASAPFTVLATSSSPREQLVCARMYAADRYPAQSPIWRGEIYRHQKIKIAYMSGEFREQATSYLTAGLFERHDRSRFELHALATGLNDHSPMRARLERAFDVFTDVAGRSDNDIATVVRGSEIDILVNLNGYFGIERTGVFAMRPAPLQVNYLGFPGTMGAAYMDYMIADRTVIPEQDRAWYSEKVAYLPHSYQANDNQRAISERPVTRAECGLPHHGFVFCCFNNTHKLTPWIFDIWMRLLSAVDGSVLWLLEANDAVRENLVRAARQRGIAAHRLVFAPWAAQPDHLARLRLADLFLDTLPHNAHTTASDALWAGLPVLTCMGSTFAGRVGASLLTAIGLPELIARDLGEYETMASKLAGDSAALAGVRSRLAVNRDVFPLFDTGQYTRNLEAVFARMWERYQRGEPPDHLS
jgi:protein O-GlcNAc transferase